jgi:AraC family transcriptional regulator of adaptative response / DNA-3-methyladenine glycosylase II
MRRVITMQMADLARTHLEGELATPPWACDHSRPRGDFLRDSLARSLLAHRSSSPNACSRLLIPRRQRQARDDESHSRLARREAVRVRIRLVLPASAVKNVSAVQAFAGVVTTGIYCRPGCGARPNPENVIRFGLAAAAEAAGFRACLRCRPYRTADLVMWSGPELVCRGVQMILDGGLDDANEEALAARLGVSARHLRRLFTSELGVTPDGLARSARAHFARRLLDDTDLTVLQISNAAGYGSLRQFNRACQDFFRASPRELRSRRRAKDRLVADGGLALRLPFRGPLDWDGVLGYLAPRATPGVEHVSGDTYRRTILLDGDPGVVELSPGDDESLTLVAHLPHWEELIHLVERTRRIPGLEFDVEEANEHLARDPRLGPLVRSRPGVRVPGTWDPFETSVRAILGQDASLSVANARIGRLVAHLGRHVPGLSQFGLTHTFPGPHDVADAPHVDAIGLTPARARSLRAFSQAVIEDKLRLDGSVSFERLVASITALPGLDEWTANAIALRLGERDAFPLKPVALRHALKENDPQVVEPWRPWRALAAMHLWVATANRSTRPIAA